MYRVLGMRKGMTSDDSIKEFMKKLFFSGQKCTLLPELYFFESQSYKIILFCLKIQNLPNIIAGAKI